MRVDVIYPDIVVHVDHRQHRNDTFGHHALWGQNMRYQQHVSFHSQHVSYNIQHVSYNIQHVRYDLPTVRSHLLLTRKCIAEMRTGKTSKKTEKKWREYLVIFVVSQCITVEDDPSFRPGPDSLVAVLFVEITAPFTTSRLETHKHTIKSSSPDPRPVLYYRYRP